MPPETHIYARPAFESQDQYNKRMAQEAAVKAERLANRAVSIPEGEISTETAAKIARENTGAAFNTYLDLMENEDTPPAVRKSCADAILDRGHGKVPGDTPTVISPTAIKIELNFVNSSGSRKSSGVLLDADKQ